MKKQNAAEECLRQILDPLENVRDGVSALHAILVAMQDTEHKPEEFIPALRFACVCMGLDIDFAVKSVCSSVTLDP